MFGSSSSEPVDLAAFSLPISLKGFIKLFWDNNSYFEVFLREKIHELDINIPDWEKISESHYVRVNTSKHPLPFSLPWLPLTVDSSNRQEISLVHKNHKEFVYIKENSRIKGIPYVDPHVITEWNLHENEEGHVCCKITLRFFYETPTLLKSAVELNSKIELEKLFTILQEDCKKKIVEFYASTNPDMSLLHLKELFPPEVVKEVINDELNANEVPNGFEIDNYSYDNQGCGVLKMSLKHPDDLDMSLESVVTLEEIVEVQYDDLKETIKKAALFVQNHDSHMELWKLWCAYPNRHKLLSILLLFANLKSTDNCSFISDNNRMESYTFGIALIVCTTLLAHFIVEFPFALIRMHRERAVLMEVTPMSISESPYYNSSLSLSTSMEHYHHHTSGDDHNTRNYLDSIVNSNKSQESLVDLGDSDNEGNEIRNDNYYNHSVISGFDSIRRMNNNNNSNISHIDNDNDNETTTESTSSTTGDDLSVVDVVTERSEVTSDRTYSYSNSSNNTIGSSSYGENGNNSRYYYDSNRNNNNYDNNNNSNNNSNSNNRAVKRRSRREIIPRDEIETIENAKVDTSFICTINFHNLFGSKPINSNYNNNNNNNIVVENHDNQNSS